MYVNSLLKYTTNTKIKILYANIKVIGPLGIISYDFSYFCKNLNKLIPKFHYITPNIYNYFANSFIISNSFIKGFFVELIKLLFGVNYGWFFSFNIAGRGFSFRVKKNLKQIYLKIKIGYSHFVYVSIQNCIFVKIAKKRNKLILFSLNFFDIAKLVWQLRRMRSKHTYKLQGIFFFNEKIKIKPGKKKQI